MEQEVIRTSIHVTFSHNEITLFYNRAGQHVTDMDALCKMSIATAEQFAAALAEAIAQAKQLERASNEMRLNWRR